MVGYVAKGRGRVSKGMTPGCGRRKGEVDVVVLVKEVARTLSVGSCETTMG